MSPFSPWAQQPALPPGSEEKEEESKWWEFWKEPPSPPQSELAEKYKTQQEQPWWQNLLFGQNVAQMTGPGGETQYGQVMGGTAPMMGIPGGGLTGLGASIGQAIRPGLNPALLKAGVQTGMKVPQWMSRHKLATGAGAVGGYLGYGALTGESPGGPPSEQEYPGQVPWAYEPPSMEGLRGAGMPAPSGVGAGLPEPGTDFETGGPGDEPLISDDGRFWWNPTGGLYGTGGWDILPTQGVQGMTPEQQMAEYAKQRDWEALESTQQQASQMAMLQAQGGFEQQLLEAQSGYARGQQEAGAAQQMAQMYAADPYKYWAQMGQGTPEAVARLTGGEIGAGEQFGHVPLSVPSQQWWGNLLPSEQEQIGGGLNWLGVDPQDWYSMKQRMIPGMGSRQMGPSWAR